MKRDRRLRDLSAQHHRALVIARALSREALDWSREDGIVLGEGFDREIDPHFRIEEEVLLPALRRAGALPLAERTETDHAFLRRTVAAARQGDALAARAFGERLTDHVRFEERELFPACEATLSDEVLDDVAERCRG
jgi:hemerythrin-like domain-containing protein